MSWSFCVGIITSAIGVGTIIALWNEWSKDYERMKFYSSRYKLRDMQLDTEMAEFDKLEKAYDKLSDEFLAHDIATSAQLQEQSEKIGEMEIELSLANGRIQQMTNLYLQEQKRADELQKELDEIFKPENFV